MTATAPVTSNTASGTSTAQALGNSLASLASNAQTFLTLLTTQLKNQDPTSPLDTNQFTAQLTQMTGVEQQLLSNQLLQQLVNQSSGTGVMSAAGLIGKSLSASGAYSTLTNGSASWQYSLGSAAANVTVQITDSSGNVVYSGAAPTGSGAQSFTWNGQNSAGQQQANGGSYTATFTATNATGASVPVNNTVTGTATAVEEVNGQTMVTIGGVQVPLSAVTAVSS